MLKSFRKNSILFLRNKSEIVELLNLVLEKERSVEYVVVFMVNSLCYFDWN